MGPLLCCGRAWSRFLLSWALGHLMRLRLGAAQLNWIHAGFLIPESGLCRQPRCQRSAVVVLSPCPRETRRRNEPASNENETKQAAWEPEVRHIRPQQQKDLRQPALEFYAREN